jgi:tetratricopeptide (TPR) repeat protein
MISRKTESARTGLAMACAMSAVMLMASVASAVHKVAIDELPMRPVITPGSGVKEWFVARFGLTWNELESRYTTAEVDKFLLRWRATYPNDPEAWLSSANWNARKSQEETVHMSTSQDGMYFADAGEDGNVILKGADGKTGAFLTESSRYIPERLSAAKRLYEEGERKFAQRLDIYENHARMLFFIDEYSQEVIVLRKMAEAVANPTLVLESTNYKKVGADANDLLLRSLHEASGRLSEVESPEAAAARLDIALISTRALPHSAIAWNDLTAAYDQQNNPDAAFKAARKAYELAPNDEIVVINLAKYCMDFGLKNEAIQHYRWIVRNSKEHRLVDKARAQLESLGDSDSAR